MKVRHISPENVPSCRRGRDRAYAVIMSRKTVCDVPPDILNEISSTLFRLLVCMVIYCYIYVYRR